jgi:hypothetical protein
MVAMGTLLNVQLQAQHVRLAGDALVLKYSVFLVSALFIALILPSALAELKPVLATLVCMPIPSVHIQNAVDNGVNSTAASLVVHTRNIISYALLLIMAAASGKICAPWNQQSSASVATQATDPWMSLSIPSVASLGVLLSIAYALPQRIRLMQLRWDDGMPSPPSASKRRLRSSPPSAGNGPAASPASFTSRTSSGSTTPSPRLYHAQRLRSARPCRLKARQAPMLGVLP